MSSDLKKCAGSGEMLMLSWLPDDEGYPGAVVCLCSYGVLVRKGSARKAVSQAGFEGMAGKVLVHYVSDDRSKMVYHKNQEG